MGFTKIELAYRVFDQSHTVDYIYIYMMLKTIFEEYKIFAIGFDNVSDNAVVISYLINFWNLYFLGKSFHQRCACNVLNLCIQNRLVLIQESIRPIRTTLHYLWKHP